MGRESLPETNHRNGPPRPPLADEPPEHRGLEPHPPIPSAHRVGAAGGRSPWMPGGGVRYFGEIEWRISGSEEQLIVLDGNTGDTFGEGRAIPDGARIITDWKSCESVDQVLGTPPLERNHVRGPGCRSVE